MGRLRDRLKREQARKRKKWPRKEFDGVMWILHPKTLDPVQPEEEIEDDGREEGSEGPHPG